MSRSRALVDLTLDSDDEGRSTARANSSRGTHDARSSNQAEAKSARSREAIQPRQSAEHQSLVEELPGPRYGVSKLRTSINTKETAFDLTADDDEASQPQNRSLNRSNRGESQTRRAAAVPIREATTPTQSRASKSINPSQPKQSASATPKRRKATSPRASPRVRDLEYSVPFRQPPRVLSSTPEKGPPPRFKHDEEANAYNASKSKASQQTARGPDPASSPSTSEDSPLRDSAPRSDECQGELVSKALRSTQYGTRSAEKATSPALPSSSKVFKSISHSAILPRKDRFRGETSAQQLLSATTKGSEAPKEANASVVREAATDDELSAAAQDAAKLRSGQDLSRPASQQDESAGLGSQAKTNLGAGRVKTASQGDMANQASKVPIFKSMSSAASARTARSGDTETPSLGNRDIPAISEKVMGTDLSSRLVQGTVVSPKMPSKEIPTSSIGARATPLGDGHDDSVAMKGTFLDKATVPCNPGGVNTIHNGTELETSLSRPVMEDSMRRHLNELRKDHEYFMKSWLGRARRACDRRAPAKGRVSSASGLDHTAGFMTVAAQYIQTESPFAAMRPLELHIAARNGQLQPSTGRLQQQIVKPVRSEKPFINVPVDVYTSEAVSVPPYLSYISIRRNILAENDRSLKYYPYFGEEGPGKKSGLEKELEDRFNNRIKDLPLRHWFAEQAEKLGPYAARYLEDVGCQMMDVLYLILDTDRLIEPDEVSASGSMRKWHVRCFATDFGRTNKKWQEVFCRLRCPEQQALARADLACRAFYNTTKLSLWYIVRNHESATSLLTWSQEKKGSPSGSQGLSTYADLGCLVCHVHDCPCHGEYEEPNGDKDTDGRNCKLKEDSHSEDADSDSDNGLSHNLRRRVVAEPLLLREHKSQRRPIAFNDNDVNCVHDFLGLNADGSVTGSWNRTGDRGNSGFADTDLCSPQCFWKKANRSTSVSKWAEDELELLQNLLPAYISSRRGPCMMKSAFDKPCEEVFNMMRSVSSVPSAVPDEMPATLPSNISRPVPRRGWQYWYRNSVTHIHEERLPFRPCSHDGSCQDAACSCYKANITCEKTCQCSDGCERRFRGCNCAQGNQVCWMSERCDCYQLNRECDPDLCGTCGACEVLDPINRYNDKVAHRKCSNVYMQRGVPKRTLMGHSDIQGWGLYMGEDVKTNEFLGEYKGEIVSKTEGDRRGAVYHYRGIEYLFGLNKSQEIDSTRAGNKMRFINNSKKHINCYPKKVFCNTVQRIGMYAKRDIKSGEELYFDYGYPEAVTKNFWDKGEPKIAASAGNTKKGKAAVKQGQLAKAKKNGRPIKHGGARSGAGRKGRAIKATSGPSGKRESKDRRPEGTKVGSIDSAHHGLDGVEGIEVGESDVDDDAVSEVDPDELEGSESEDESYHSDEVEEKEATKKTNPQKRGWITRKENLKRKRGY